MSSATLTSEPSQCYHFRLYLLLINYDKFHSNICIRPGDIKVNRRTDGRTHTSTHTQVHTHAHTDGQPKNAFPPPSVVGEGIKHTNVMSEIIDNLPKITKSP